MKLTLGVALGAILVALGVIQASGLADRYERYLGLIIAVLAAVSAYLHTQGVDGVDGGTDGGPQAPPPSG